MRPAITDLYGNKCLESILEGHVLDTKAAWLGAAGIGLGCREGESALKREALGQQQRLMPIISALWMAKAGGSPEVGSSRPA